MKDTLNQQRRSNKIFKTIQSFESLFPDEFETCGIYKCGHCNATGIKNKSSLENCTDCGGMGYVGFKKLYGHHVCRTCNGYGCRLCKHSGTVDWITHANSSDVMNDKPFSLRA